MDPDVALVIGLVLAVFSIAGMVSAFSNGQAPRASAITVLIAGGLVLLAINAKPSGYTLQDIPEAFARVVRLVL